MDFKEASALIVGVLFYFFLIVTNFVAFIYEILTKSPANVDNSKSIVVITGCDSGFGKLTTQNLSKLGFKVISTCMTEEGIKNLKGIAADAILCDVTNQSDVDNLVKCVQDYSVKNGCKLWGLVNNAGIANFGAVDWTSMNTFEKVMDVNFFGVLKVTKGLLPLLKSNKEGRIVFLSSVAGLSYVPLGGAYAASKHAIEGLTKALRLELQPWNLHVSNINPGIMGTPLVELAKKNALNEFQNAPSEIKEQYQLGFLDNYFALTPWFAEDPMNVVDCITDAITTKNPPMWFFPGFQAQFLRMSVVPSGGTLDFISFFLKPIIPQLSNKNH